MPAPKPEKTGLWPQVADSAGWLWHSTASIVYNAPQTWREATPQERGRLFADAMLSGALVTMVILAWPGWFMPVVFALLSLVLMVTTLGDIEDHHHTQNRVSRLLTTQPTGAPRVVEMACPSCQVAYRFVYGPTGWEFAGPAHGHGPNVTAEEAARG